MNLTSVRKAAISEGKMTRAYNDTLNRLCSGNPNIITLGDCPIRKSSVKSPGMQVMAGVAAGLSLTGNIPFLHGSAQDLTRHSFDQLFTSAAYAGLNLKIIGRNPGVTAERCSGARMPFEDIGLMRLIPNVTIYEASDAVMLASLLKMAADEYGVHYIRKARDEPMQLYSEQETFEKGKGKVLREGDDLTIFASGIMVAESLKAADRLAIEGIDAAVIDLYSIKPLDTDLVIKYAKKTGAVITAENHNIIGGIGSAVAEVLGEHCPAPLARIGVKEQFGHSGQMEYLKMIYGLTFCDIVEAAKTQIKRK